MLATLLALALTAQQGPQHGQPYDLGEDLRWARSGAPQEGAVTYLNATNTLPLQCDGDTVAGAASRPCCYPWGSQIVVSADKPVTLCFSMTSTIALGAYASEQSMVLTDANGIDGQGACVDIAAVGQTVDMIPLYPAIAVKPGSRSPITASPCVSGNLNGCTAGWCPTAATDKPSPDAPVYPACRVSGDCTDASAGSTCDTTLSAADRQEMAEHGCAFIVGRASAASTRVTARVER